MNNPSSPTMRRMMHSHSDVCIVGNGAIAKTTALAFAQVGQSVTLLTPASVPAAASAPALVPAWDVRVFALNHTAHALLSSLKVWGALDAERVAPVDAMVVSGDGAQAGGLGFDAYGAHVGTLAWIIEDRNLNQALDAALRFAQNVNQVQGRASRIEWRSDAAVVHLDGGDSITAALVVGADGAQSWVRGQCDIGLDYRSYGQRGVVSNFECEKPHHGAAHQWFTGADGIVALLPLPGNRVSLVWSAPDALADVLEAESAGQLAERLAVYCQDKLGVLTPVQPELVRSFPLRLMRPHSMVAPRVALVGDAAHVVHPMAGHGMNLGFADVAQLVKTITEREPQRGIGDERVLARYARARKEDVLLMVMATDGLARLFGADIEPLRVVRNLGLSLLDKLPGLKRRMISHALGK
ncbi:FAD-dependent monooxygenase [Janthinobacterium aquaticum]|uniref:FAD-dependent monooxygenase n=1 Tax=Janthinobacterium sp. FT58W TaxID=2654254 RepID=UPI001D004116|nr:FAD-dependent monooxygenase [Janthinobacterium sp. FT58W]